MAFIKMDSPTRTFFKTIEKMERKETLREKIARIQRKRRAIEQDYSEFGEYPDLDEEEIKELEWLSEQEEAWAEMRADYLEEKRRGLF